MMVYTRTTKGPLSAGIPWPLISEYMGSVNLNKVLSIKGLRELFLSQITPVSMELFSKQGYTFNRVLQLLLQHEYFAEFRKFVRVFSNLISVSVDAFYGILRLLLQHGHFVEFRWIVQKFSHLFSVSVDAFCAIPEEKYVTAAKTLRQIVLHSTVHPGSMLFVYQHMALSEFLNTQTNPVTTRDMLYVFVSTVIMTPANQRTFLPLGHTVVFDENQIRSQYELLEMMLGPLDEPLYGYSKCILVIMRSMTAEVMSYQWTNADEFFEVPGELPDVLPDELADELNEVPE
jgi:hypothetical protein